MVGLLVVAFIFTLFLSGRLPKGPSKDANATEETAAGTERPPELAPNAPVALTKEHINNSDSGPIP